MKVELKIPVELGAQANRLRDDAGLFASLAPVIDEQNDFTIAEIQEKRLSQKGPETLGVRMGHLRRSIRRSNAVAISGGVISGIGSNVKYLGVHEFGFDEDVTVRPYMRTRKQQQVIFGNKRVVRLGDVPVRMHKRHMKFPARAPIQRGIMARLGSYHESLSAGMAAFYRGKK